MTADTHTHVLSDDAELDRLGLLARMVQSPVLPPAGKQAD
jgi:hypothetical protein